MAEEAVFLKKNRIFGRIIFKEHFYN